LNLLPCLRCEWRLFRNGSLENSAISRVYTFLFLSVFICFMIHFIIILNHSWFLNFHLKLPSRKIRFFKLEVNISISLYRFLMYLFAGGTTSKTRACHCAGNAHLYSVLDTGVKAASDLSLRTPYSEALYSANHAITGIIRTRCDFPRKINPPLFPRRARNTRRRVDKSEKSRRLTEPMTTTTTTR